jgi:hypothetical protein
MRITPLTSRRLLPLVATLLAGLALAACGSANSTKSATSAASAASGQGAARSTKLVACLKSHGVTLPAGAGRFRRGATGASGPGGAGRGGGFLFGGGGGRPGGATGRRGFGGGFANNPKLAAAFRACGGAAFGGRPSAATLARFRAQREKSVAAFIACVSKNGYKLPAPNYATGQSVFPKSLQTNTKFLAAAKPCEHLLTTAGPPGGGFAPGGGAPPPGAGAPA